MAFVSQSERKIEINTKSISKNPQVGPGSYDHDNRAHKEAMKALYPRKTIPFNESEPRFVDTDKKSPNKRQFPGPGDYQPVASIFEHVQETQVEINDKRSYFVKENGKLNQRTQQYACQSNKTMNQMRMQKQIAPGPGAYETNTTSFMKTQTSRKGALSLQNSANKMVNAPNKVSIPSIPSRFLTPVINTEDVVQSKDGQNICQVSKLVDDPTLVGPGSYEMLRNSSFGSNGWTQAKRPRNTDFPVQPTTQPTIGPGSYEQGSDTKHKKSNNYSFGKQARTYSGYPAHNFKTPKVNRGSIKANYDMDESSSDDEATLRKDGVTSPGPADYDSAHLTSAFKARGKPDHLQFFGSSVERFKLRGNQNLLGPGQYRIDKPISCKNSVLQNAGSSCFKSPPRKEDQQLLTLAEVPGPADYLSDKVIQSIGSKTQRLKKGRHHQTNQFGVKTKRFAGDETIAPGPGNYRMPNSCKVRNEKLQLASYQSATERKLDHFIGLSNPGVGEYEVADHQSIGINKIQGGAPNNFLILTRNNNPSIRKFDTKVQPRLPDTDHMTPSNVGPGSYGKKGSPFAKSLIISPSSKIIGKGGANSSSSKNDAVNQSFGSLEQRFNNKGVENPGPGSYNNQNKWIQKTFNLKFIQIQPKPLNFVNNNQGMKNQNFQQTAVESVIDSLTSKPAAELDAKQDSASK